MYINKDDEVITRVALEQTMLDFVETFEDIENPHIVCDTFQKFVENLGFLNSTRLHLPFTGKSLLDCMPMKGWPEKRAREYAEADNYMKDPMARERGLSYFHFAWNDVSGTRELSRSESETMNRSDNCGMDSGFVVPIFETNGSVALVGLAGKNVELAESARSAIILASIYLHNRLFDLKRMAREERVDLTPREIECLHWVAAGKSDWQIGQILDISAKTVNYHVENVKRKFGVATRIQAVVTAMRKGKLLA